MLLAFKAEKRKTLLGGVNVVVFGYIYNWEDGLRVNGLAVKHSKLLFIQLLKGGMTI